MAIKLFIVDFELIEKANLVISGLTAISGESCNGKTAVYNSLYVLANNTQGTNYIRRSGATTVPTGCRIGVLFEDEQTAVTFEKKTSPVYTLDSPKTKQLPKGVLVLDKAGRGATPVEIASTVNMEALDIDGLNLHLNFIPQMSEPMLKKLTHQQLYKVAVKSFDGEKIQEAIALCKEEQVKSAESIKTKSIEIDVQKKARLGIIDQLQVFNPLEELVDNFPSYSKNLQVLPTINGYLERRNVLKNKLGKVERSIKQFIDIKKLNDLHISAKESLITARTLLEYHRRRVALHTDISTLGKKLAPYAGLIALVSDYEAYIENCKLMKTVVDLNNDRLSLIEERSYAERKFSFYGKDFVKIEQGVTLYRKQKETLLFVSTVIEKRTSLILRLRNVSKRVTLLQELPDFVGHGQVVKNSSVVTMNQLRRTTLVDKKAVLVERLLEVSTELKEAEYMLENNICPACGHACECETNK